MTTSRPTIAFASLLFTSAIGAKDCGFYWPSGGGSATSSGGSPPSDKPFCLFDPPVGCCKAICMELGIVDFTPQCKDISANTLTLAFFDAIDASVKKAALAGRRATRTTSTTT